MDLPSVFVSYSHRDEKWKDLLKPHLKMLEQADRLTIWDDRKIDAGVIASSQLALLAIFS